MMTSRMLRLSGIAALIALGVGACNSDTLTDVNQDPNNPTSAPPGPVFTSAARLAMGRWLGGGAMDLRGPEFTVQHLAEVQYPDEDAYRRLGPGDTDGDFINAYTQELKNLQAVVDVGKSLGEADPDSLRQPGEGVGERVGARPPHLSEERRQLPWMAGADKPEPAILGRSEDKLVTAEQAEGGGDVTRRECGNVAADQHHRTGRAVGQSAAHADAQIAAALTDGFDASTPVPGMMARLIRGYYDPQPPPPVPGEPAQQKRDHQALEAHCRDIADFPREPPLTDPELRRTDEQHEMAAHQP